MTIEQWVYIAIATGVMAWFWGPLVWRKLPALPDPPSAALHKAQVQVEALRPKPPPPSLPRAFINLGHTLQAEGVWLDRDNPPQLILSKMQWENFRYAMGNDPIMWKDAFEPEAVTFQRMTIGGIVVRVARPSDS